MRLAPSVPLLFFGHLRRAAAALAVGAVVAVGGAGCADLVTYAGESRQQGIKHYNDGQYPEAAGAFTSAIKQRPEDYQSYYYLGRTYESMKNYHQAAAQYRTALRVMSNSLAGQDDGAFREKVLDGLAVAIAGGADESLEKVTFARTNGPSTAEDWFVVAKVRRLQRDADSALDAYAKAAAADPKNLAVAREHGLYLLQLNQRTKAAAELRRAYVLNKRLRQPDDAGVNDGLRSIGVVPGPSLGEEGDLAQPLVPRGPLPEVEFGSGKAGGQAASTDGQ